MKKLLFLFLLIGLPSILTVEINGQKTIQNYATLRNDLITKANNGQLSFGEVKAYLRILNIENKIKRLKGKTIQEFNNDILTR